MSFEFAVEYFNGASQIPFSAYHKNDFEKVFRLLTASQRRVMVRVLFVRVFRAKIMSGVVRLDVTDNRIIPDAERMCATMPTDSCASLMGLQTVSNGHQNGHQRCWSRLANVDSCSHLLA